MNISPVISLPVSADLSSGKEYECVKLTSTGVAIATSITDRIIGTLLRGNDAPANGQTAVGMACDVFLTAGNGLHFIKVGNDTAIASGDELEQDATDGRLVKRVAGAVVGQAVDSCPATSDGGVIRAIMFPPPQAGVLGSAGAVTQITSASTGVTVNALSGAITTVALTAAAGAEIRFVVTNSFIAIGDTVSFATTYNGGGTPIIGSALNVTAGTFDVVVTNLHASAALDALMVINFVINKAAV